MLSQRRELPERASKLKAPLFNLTGLAIGNGLIDPHNQVLAPLLQGWAPSVHS